MPFLSQEPQANQTALLPTERTVSGIPKATDAANWEYPSPQQFHNALVRKGKEAPVEHVESMVDIHNWLNEACWQEITQWEQKYYPECKPTLVKFTGRPDDVSPMARLYATFYGLHFNDLGLNCLSIDMIGQLIGQGSTCGM